MTKAEELRNNFNQEIQTKIITIFVYGYLVLAVIGYVFASLVVRSHLSALTHSQNYSVSVQEWRSVINGVHSGWSLYPRLDSICLVANDGRLLDSQGGCPTSSPLTSFGLGLTQLVEFPQFHVRIQLTTSLWLWGLVFPFLVFSVIGLFVYFFRKSFILKSQLETLDLIENVDSTQEELTAFQRIIHTQTNEIINLKKQAIVAQVASQVSHDIRSPLTALDIVLADLSSLPEEKRNLARMAVSRIKDIANNLLSQHREHVQPLTDPQVPLASEVPSPQMIVPLVEGILSEKRLQLQSKNGIQIVTDIAQEALGAFALIQASVFKRLLSNLINNSIEAIDGSGKISIRVFSTKDKVEVVITDNGKGIPPEILIRLGQRGVTFGKTDGNGFGVHHAKTTIESWGGRFTINSNLKMGTNVILSLPAAKPPVWFLPSLELEEVETLVIMDDDPSVKELWHQRFIPIKNIYNNLSVLFFANPEQVIDWYQTYPQTGSRRFLLDYEILGSSKTGLDLAEELKIGPDSILVTSRWEDPGLQTKCVALGLRLLPKALAGFVPVKFPEG